MKLDSHGNRFFYSAYYYPYKMYLYRDIELGILAWTPNPKEASMFAAKFQVISMLEEVKDDPEVCDKIIHIKRISTCSTNKVGEWQRR